jgi:hypothetical protein
MPRPPRDRGHTAFGELLIAVLALRYCTSLPCVPERILLHAEAPEAGGPTNGVLGDCCSHARSSMERTGPPSLRSELAAPGQPPAQRLRSFGSHGCRARRHRSTLNRADEDQEVSEYPAHRERLRRRSQQRSSPCRQMASSHAEGATRPGLAAARRISAVFSLEILAPEWRSA